MKKRSTDLTEGGIVRLITVFALPILLSQIFQNLYNSVDSIVVGNFVGTTALAAVSSCGDIAQLLVGFFTGLSAGSGVLFARCYGARDYQGLHDAIHTAVTFSALLGCLMAGLGICLSPFLLSVVRCPADVLPEAGVYLRIYFVGILFTSIYNVGAGVLRAVGDSRTPLYFLLAASAVNIALDLFFVTVVRMGVAGVAVATVCSQLLSVFLLFRRMVRTDDVYRFSFRDMRIQKSYLLQVIDLGIPAAIQSSLNSISNLFVQRYINSFGSSAMAGIGAAKKIDKFIGLFSQTIGLSATTFVSQNLGAGKRGRALRGVRVCLVMGLVTIVVPGAAIVLETPFFVRIFTTDRAAIDYGVDMLLTMMPFYCFQTFNQVYSNAVRGFGRSRAVMVLSLLGMIGCRQVFLSVSMAVSRSVANIYYCFPVGWFFSALFVMIYYFIVVKRDTAQPE